MWTIIYTAFKLHCFKNIESKTLKARLKKLGATEDRDVFKVLKLIFSNKATITPRACEIAWMTVTAYSLLLKKGLGNRRRIYAEMMQEIRPLEVFAKKHKASVKQYNDMKQLINNCHIKVKENKMEQIEKDACNNAYEQLSKLTEEQLQWLLDIAEGRKEVETNDEND